MLSCKIKSITMCMSGNINVIDKAKLIKKINELIRIRVIKVVNMNIEITKN